MLILTTPKWPPVCHIHVGVGLAHGVEVSKKEPVVVDSAAGTLDVEGAVDSDAWCVAARTELAADALEILLQGLVLRIAASLALFACFSEVVLRLAGGTVDGEALWADDLVNALDDGEDWLQSCPVQWTKLSGSCWHFPATAFSKRDRYVTGDRWSLSQLIGRRVLQLRPPLTHFSGRWFALLNLQYSFKHVPQLA